MTAGQLAYEWEHLQAKLKARCPAAYERNLGTAFPEPHPVFRVTAGGVEGWERR